MAMPTRSISDQTNFDMWQVAFFSRLNARFENSSAQDIITWSIQNFGAGLSISTAYGASGMVLMDMALRIQPDVDIFYVDTGFFFPETAELIQRAGDHYQRTFRRITPELTVAEQEQRHGAGLYARQPDLCCSMRKVEPLRRALVGSTAWMTSVRRDQSSTRSGTAIVEWNSRHSLVKLAPLARWTEEDVWNYIREWDVPYNELHDRNYPSIGCWPCTRAVEPGEDLRAGRWSGTSKTECGLHWPLPVSA